jgi:hypothetical protein
MDTPFILPAIVMALLCLMFAATKLSRAGRIAPGLQPMLGKPVDIRVWGTPITGFRIHTVRAFSAALLFLLEPVGGGKTTLLKVAQPQPARPDEQGLVIPDARYMQWAGKRMPRVEGLPALEMKVVAGD